MQGFAQDRTIATLMIAGCINEITYYSFAYAGENMGLFITFEGLDKSGKSTQVRLLAEELQEKGYDFVSEREPGGTEIGEIIRTLVTGTDRKSMDLGTEILLFNSARSALVHEKIKPCLERGGIVICDRYMDSTIAYQGYGRKLDPDKILILRAILEFATEGLKPDITFYLDLPEVQVKERLDRVQAIQLKLFEKVPLPDEFDRAAIEFHARVKAGYEEIGQMEVQRWVKISAVDTIQDIQNKIRKRVIEKLREKHMLRERATRKRVQIGALRIDRNSADQPQKTSSGETE